MFLPKVKVESFDHFLDKCFDNTEPDHSVTFFGAIKGMAIYRGLEKNYYCQKSKIYQQIRIFDNSPGVFFVKDIHGEQLFTLHRSKSFVSEDQAFINY